MKHTILIRYLFGFCMLLFSFQQVRAQWPKEVALSNGAAITLYELQPDLLDGNTLKAHSAAAIKPASGADPVFGAVFYTITLRVDGNSGTLQSLKMDNIRFPTLDSNSFSANDISFAIEKKAPQWNLKLDLDQVSNEMSGNAGTENYDNNPPKILFANKPSTLITIDGEPQIQKDSDLDADKVVNTPFLIFKEGNIWNLYFGGIWYRSNAITSGWVQNKNLSSKLKTIDKQLKAQEAANDSTRQSTAAPVPTQIIVSTVPAELIQTTGEPTYNTISGTSLLYVNNSENDLFKDINTQKTYVLLAGRWYQAPDFSGPWTYIPADQLPADFAKIPEGTEKDAVLANVAGTEPANEAIMDAQVPQVSRIDRSQATTSVTYDGDPIFQNIAGTNLQLAENSSVTVIRSNGQYYAVDNGVWFVSNTPQGPWTVSENRPSDINNIPASSAAYNTRYVYIYESTPQYVYMGYTPGYIGNYVYGPTVIYGTGYYYRPWYHRHYYPRPLTWGFGFRYNPWWGWSFNWGYNTPFIHFSISWGHPAYGWGWFGPSLYRPPYRPVYHNGYYGRPGRPAGRPIANRPQPSRPSRPGFTGGTARPQANRPGFGNSIYDNRPGISRPAITNRPVSPATRPGRNTQGQNNRPANTGRPATGNTGRPQTSSPTPSARPNAPTNNSPATRPAAPATTPSTRPATPSRPTSPSPSTPTRPATSPSVPSSRPTQSRPATTPSTRRPAVSPNKVQQRQHVNRTRSSRPRR